MTPHASFLALNFAPSAAVENLLNLQRCFEIFGPYGFWDSVDIASGKVARRILALDQGMIMAAIANALCAGSLQNALAPSLEPSIRPLLDAETFY